MRARLIFAVAAGLWLTATARDLGDQWIAATVLPPLALETSVEVWDRHGSLLRAYTVADGRWRLAVDPTAVDPAYVAMLLAFEDKRFADHDGVDLQAMARAVAQERRLTKDQILQLYLLLAPYGGNLEGIRAATLSYFGKEPRRLTPAEVALLVAIPQSPENRRPDRNAVAAEVARARVLDRAVGAGIIDADQAQAARTEPVPHLRRAFPALAPHMADRALAEAPEADTHRLTVDAVLQGQLEALARDVVASHGDRLQIAMVVADHKSGEILASVGSSAYQADARQGFIDMTRAIRSPGSTLKPLVYGLAFDEGLAHPETLMEDRPTVFGGYAPQNFDRLFRGTIRVREALQQSLNIPVVALTEALGPAKLLAALRRAGVNAKVPGGQPGLAVALGGLGVTLEDMVQLYAAIARGGVSLPLTHRMDGTREDGARVLSDIAAWEVSDILAGLAPPPGAPANRLAYKTGTSYGNRDAWAIGFDGRHVIGIWMGRPDGTPVPGAFGADLAAPVLYQAFARLKPALDPQPPAPAATLLVANAQLPRPLQKFRSRFAAFDVGAVAPAVAFPPDGAEVELLPDGLLVRVRGGDAPFTWLADGVPLAVAMDARETMLALPGPGFVILSVIDAAGRSARASVRVH